MSVYVPHYCLSINSPSLCTTNWELYCGLARQIFSQQVKQSSVCNEAWRVIVMFGELFRAMQVSFHGTHITGTCSEFLSFFMSLQDTHTHTHNWYLFRVLELSGTLQINLRGTHNQYLFRIFELCISLQMSFHGIHTCNWYLFRILELFRALWMGFFPNFYIPFLYSHVSL
jgi:hypothetical protein